MTFGGDHAEQKGYWKYTEEKERTGKREKEERYIENEKTGMFPLQIGFKSHVSFHVMHVHPLNKK